MRKRIILITLILLLAYDGIWGKEVTDTLESTKRDRVIVTYDIIQNNGHIIIKFLDVKKKLGQTYRDKYKRLDEVAVLFFDRTGNYGDNMEFSGMNTEAFMIPKEVKYQVSKDGYFLLNDSPSLSLELQSIDPTKLSIPLFLAHYEGKRRYKVFCQCGNLVVTLSKKRLSTISDNPTPQLTTQTITSHEEVDVGFSDVDEARILINKVSDLLNEQEEYPFSDELKQAISSLRDRSYRITDNHVSFRISEVLSACKLKEEELRNEAKASAAAASRDAELQSKIATEQAQARQDSIAKAAQKKADEDKKHNLWLIIGGAILAILTFVGNQVFQHIRNVKNQKSIMDMQDTIVRRAENEAKRRARNMAQNQINRVQREARQKTRNAIHESIEKIGKNKVNNKRKTI